MPRDFERRLASTLFRTFLEQHDCIQPLFWSTFPMLWIFQTCYEQQHRSGNGQRNLTKNAATTANSRPASINVLHPQFYQRRRRAAHLGKGRISPDMLCVCSTQTDTITRYPQIAGSPSNTVACKLFQPNSLRTTPSSPRRKCHLGSRLPSLIAYRLSASSKERLMASTTA